MNVKEKIEDVVIQVEYTIIHYVVGSQSIRDKHYEKVNTLSGYINVVSKEKLEGLKREFEADELFVSSILIISQSENGQVNTYLEADNLITSVNLKAEEYKGME